MDGDLGHGALPIASPSSDPPGQSVNSKLISQIAAAMQQNGDFRTPIFILLEAGRE
jgi:hypothetical protein